MLYDIIVVGAGPAGLTAGANAANRGLKTLILEGQSVAGGQPIKFYPKKLIIDHPGFPKGVTGKELSKRLYEQALNSQAEIRFQEPMIDMKNYKKHKTVITRRGKYKGRRVILATGLHNIPRQHPALKDYEGSNVTHYVKDPTMFRNKNVLVIGGGDTAFDRANMISKYAKSTTIIIRENMTKAKQKSQQIAEKNNIKILFNTDLARLHKKKAILQTKGKKIEVPCDSVVVSIGFVSSLDVLSKIGFRKTRNHHIKVNEHMETSIPGVFAAGDLASDVKLIATACANGIIAAVSTFESIKSPYWLNK